MFYNSELDFLGKLIAYYLYLTFEGSLLILGRIDTIFEEAYGGPVGLVEGLVVGPKVIEFRIVFLGDYTAKGTNLIVGRLETAVEVSNLYKRVKKRGR